MIAEGRRRSWLLQGPLVLVFLMPLFYYPLSGPLGRLLGPLLPGGSTPQAVFALLLAGLVLVGLIAMIAGEWRPNGRVNWRATASSPITWAVLLVVWMSIVTVLRPLQPTATQNLLTYGIAVAVITYSLFDLSIIERTFPSLAVLLAGFVIACGLVGLVYRPIFEVVGNNPRIFGMYGVLAVVCLFGVPMAWPRRTAAIAAVYLAIVISTSRIALLAALVAAVVGSAVVARRRKSTMTLGVVAAVVILAGTLRIPVIADRTWGGALKQESLPINDSGRLPVWLEVFQSWLRRPFVGQGAGSSQTVAEAVGLDQPHQEYLRILHDGGIVAAAIVLVFVVLATRALWPRRNLIFRAPAVLAGFLLIVAGLVGGLVENFLVFPSVMWPSAVVLGLALRLATTASLTDGTGDGDQAPPCMDLRCD